MKVAFVICTEPQFEKKSRLLVRSIRSFCGFLANAPIYSYSPRRELLPSADCLAEFRSLNVEPICDVLNDKWSGYGLANKPCILSHAERYFDHDVLVFVDSDMVFLQEPVAFELPGGEDVALRPVGKSNIGALNETDANYEYWLRLYRIAGARPSRTVRSVIDRRLLLEYYNSGLICARRRAGLFSAFNDNFECVMTQKIVPADPYYIEQSVFSATVTARAKTIHILPDSYNVMGLRELFLALPEGASPVRPVCLHYFNNLDQGRWRKTFEEQWLPLTYGNICWLTANLEELESGKSNRPDAASVYLI